jgi:hypothetical protein
MLDGRKIMIMMWPVPADRKNAVASYKTMIKNHLGTERIGRVDGVPALIIDQHTVVNHSNPAWIEFYKNGIDVNVYSASFTTSALLKLGRYLEMNRLATASARTSPC